MSALSAGISRAYLDACLDELRALKPGNVHVYAAGHNMTVREFEVSARASAPVMGAQGLSVGERIHESIRRTRAVAGCNTNLGIVLLCAPLASAAFAMDEHGLRAALHEVLTGLDVRDAEETFAAIRLASPAGLGSSPEHDVHERATVTLLEAMTAARARDRIAAQYASDYRDVFGIGIPRLSSGLARWGDLHWAATSAYLGFLAAFPDSHVARKHGLARAERLRSAAAPVDAALHQAASASDLRSTLLSLDEALKQEGINPGTSADLTVTSLFARDLMRDRA